MKQNSNEKKEFIQVNGMLLQVPKKELLSVAAGSVAFYSLKSQCSKCGAAMENKIARSYATIIICPNCGEKFEISSEQSNYLLLQSNSSGEIYEHINVIRELVAPYAKSHEARYKLDTLELYATENSDVPTFQKLMIGLLYLTSECKFPRETGIRKKLDRYVKSIENTGRGDVDLLRQEEAHR